MLPGTLTYTPDTATEAPLSPGKHLCKGIKHSHRQLLGLSKSPKLFVCISELLLRQLSHTVETGRIFLQTGDDLVTWKELSCSHPTVLEALADRFLDEGLSDDSASVLDTDLLSALQITVHSDGPFQSPT